jgi:hypothetical protein
MEEILVAESMFMFDVNVVNVVMGDGGIDGDGHIMVWLGGQTYIRRQEIPN